jgi:SAM-dependent methyltransferase
MRSISPSRPVYFTAHGIPYIMERDLIYFRGRLYMSMNDPAKIRDGVHDAYSAAAERPGEKHPFPVGRRFAESLGYPRTVLDRLPAVAVQAFAGVSNVSVFAEIPEGSIVLDLGCGAGLDSLIAAERTEPEGGVVGVDFSRAMLAHARRAAHESGAANVEFFESGAEELPLEDATIDIALVNGIFNLNPVRGAIFRELARVVRPGGLVYCAELILKGPLPESAKAGDDDWFA